MGMSLITAMEIFTNPYDLEVTVGRTDKDSKFSIFMSRGPGHRFKILITSEPFAKKLEDAIKGIEEILGMVVQVMEKEFENRESIPSQYLNPDNQRIDRSKILTPELIEQITESLHKNKFARTYEMLAEEVG